MTSTITRLERSMKHKKYNYKCHELIRWTAAALLQNCMRRLKNYKVLVLRSINEQTSRNWETVRRTHGGGWTPGTRDGIWREMGSDRLVAWCLLPLHPWQRRPGPCGKARRNGIGMGSTGGVARAEQRLRWPEARWGRWGCGGRRHCCRSSGIAGARDWRRCRRCSVIEQVLAHRGMFGDGV